MIKECEMIGLIETWEETEKWSEEKLEGYDWKCIKAKREHKKGRARGGMMLAIKKGWEKEKIKWKEGETKEVIGIEVDRKKEKWLIILVYMGREKEKNMETMSKWIEKAKDRKTIVSKSQNQEGKDLIEWVNENGLVIRNGNVRGDEEGDFMYMGARGSTVDR